MKDTVMSEHICENANGLAEELSGYFELGMKREAMKLARKILAKPRLKAVEFDEAMRTLCTLGSRADLRKCSKRVEEAYSRQSHKTRRAMSDYMLGYYYTLDDSENALRFISAHTMKIPTDAVFVMDLLLEANRMDEAKQLAAACEKLVRVKQPRFTASILIEATAAYYARVGEWDKALYFWQHAPLEQPFRQNALSGIVAIHLARALEAVRTGLHALDNLEKHPDQETFLTLHGNDEGMTHDAQKELLRFKRGIEKLLPKARQKNFGLDT